MRHVAATSDVASMSSDPVDLSKLSPIERARLAALVELDGDANLREHLLGAVGRSEPAQRRREREVPPQWKDRKSTRLNSSHQIISYAVFCLKKKKKERRPPPYVVF